MTFYIRDVISEDFLHFIPLFILENIDSKSRTVKYKLMDDYLKKYFNTSIEDINNQMLEEGFKFNKVFDVYSIDINPNIVENKSGEKLINLVKLIDYGNLDIKGINLINSSIKYVAKNILNIYRLYNLRGGS